MSLSTQLLGTQMALLMAAALPLCVFAGAAIEPVPAPSTQISCRDDVIAKIVIDPALDADFFRTHKSSYPWHIIEHKDGHLEDTLGGNVSRKSVSKIEHSANCHSNHQGDHVMAFCEATAFDAGLELTLSGGLPAYASSLHLSIRPDKNLSCSFEAVYPRSLPGEKLTWTITKKTFKMKRENPKSGERLLGWLSVEFEESCTVADKVTRRQYRIEGFLKPIIRKSPPTS